MGARRLEDAFAKRRGSTGLIPFLTAGFPSVDASLELMHGFEEMGALALEIGIPFSDPIADGPEIQRASEAALRLGVGPDETLELIARFRARGRLPIVIMTYANPVLMGGVERFAKRAHEAGVDGMIVSDLPPDEAPEVWRAFDAHDLATILLVAPTSPAERLPRVVSRCRGFVYCLARTGVTGRSAGYSGPLAERIAAVRALTDLPIAVGFGISSGQEAQALRGAVDALVVGAAFMRTLAESDGTAALSRTRALGKEILAALE